MSSPKVTPEDAHFTRRTVEAAIRIGLLIMIAAAWANSLRASIHL